mgnify:FL=1
MAVIDPVNKDLRPGEIVNPPGVWIRVSELIARLSEIKDQDRYVVIMMRPPLAVAEATMEYSMTFRSNGEAVLVPDSMAAPMAVSLLGSCLKNRAGRQYGVDRPLLFAEDGDGPLKCVVLWADAGEELKLPSGIS